MIQLLTVTLAGKTIRLGSQAVDIDGADGRHRYQGGLPPLDVEERLEILSEGSPAELSTDLLVPLDLAALTSEGHRLRGGRVELAYHDDGDTWEQRRIAIDGRIDSGSAPPKGEVCHLKITGRPNADPSLFPLDGDDLRDITLGVADVDVSKTYPWVFGNPGVYNTSAGLAAQNCPATPAYAVGSGANTHAVISSLPIDMRGYGLLSNILRVYNLTTGTNDLATGAWLNNPQIYDYRNKPVESIVLTAYLPAVPTVGDTLGLAWIGPGGQVYRNTSLDRVGDVLRDVMAKSPIPVDWRRTEPVCRSFDWIVGGYWDQRISAWDWIRNNMLSILPVSRVFGPRGSYLVRIGQPEERLAVAHIRDGLGCCVTDREDEVDQVIDSATLRYALPLQGEALRTLTQSSERPTGQGLGQTMTSRLRQALRPPGAWEQTSGIVWSDVTAGQVTQAQLQARSPRSVVSIDASESYKTLNIGSQVIVSSTRFALDRRPAIVRGFRRESSRIKLQVVVYSRS